MNLAPIWLQRYLDESKVAQHGYQATNEILIQRKLMNCPDTIWSNSIFAERALTPYTTTWCEQQIGDSALDTAINSISYIKDALVLDLGCGDGRYVRSMLQAGSHQIIALNYELPPLIKLQSSLTEEEKYRVALICGDINENPFKENISSFAIAWCLWSSASDFMQAMQSTLRLVNHGGYILNAEPVLEHALVYALVMGDEYEFLRTLESKTRPIMWHERESRYRVYTLHELRNLMRTPQLELVWEKGVNVMPSLLFGGLLTKFNTTDDFKNKLWIALQESNIEWFRQMIYLSRKN